MSIDGGEMTEITHNRSTNPQVSPDGKHIAYLMSPKSLAIIPFGGGKAEKTFPLPERPGPNLAKRMCWTPDGKALIYRDTMQGLWRQRLDEEKPELIKGAEDIQSTQIVWSLNGKGVAYTRVANMQEILLLQNAK
jgi:hypothetical protein